MTPNENTFYFASGDERLLGVLHEGRGGLRRGILVIVGGPQYRVGSHRQFLLLARDLASRDIPVMRFDCRGMGDSEGEHAGFLGLAPDIRAAIDEFFRRTAGLSEVVLWGLCDAASAAMMYAPSDNRVTGLVLVNPWVRTEKSEGRAYLRHYYARRIVNPRVWKRALTGGFHPKSTLRSVWAEVCKAAGRGEAGPHGSGLAAPETDYTVHMLRSFAGFGGRALFLLSGNDLTAAEFEDTVRGLPEWRRAMSRATVTVVRLPEADHTFSSHVWRAEVTGETLEWLRRF